MRTLLWLAAGVILGLILHLVVILALPAFASETVWSRIAALADEDKVVVLPKVVAGQPNPLQLDPKLAYAVCRVDLSRGPGVLNGT
ncbi:MAG: DUF1254 domain-containing protein, partial [Devosia sp.]